ncbi:unnamed protein product, partial [Ixodes pacificus]
KGFSKICCCATRVGHVYACTALSLSSFQALACLVFFPSALPGWRSRRATTHVYFMQLASA